MTYLLRFMLAVLSLALAALMLYGFWLCGFVGLFLKEPALQAGAVGIGLLQAYLIYYRLRRVGHGKNSN
jgi:hypothetical protein